MAQFVAVSAVLSFCEFFFVGEKIYYNIELVIVTHSTTIN